MSSRQEVLKRYLEMITSEEGGFEAIADGSAVLERTETRETPEEAASVEEQEHARKAIKKIARGDNLSRQEEFALEAIILPRERPVIDIIKNSFVQIEAPFEHLGRTPIRENIDRTIPAIGRIGVPSRPALPFAGTGFVVGESLLITNRHVASIFCQGIGCEGLSFQPGQSADIDFKQEAGSDESILVSIRC